MGLEVFFTAPRQREKRGKKKEKCALTELQTHAPRAGINRERTSIYQEVSNKIIHDLEQGLIPWVQPWGDLTSSAAIGLPTNADTKNAYSGINILLLWGPVFERGFSSQSWLTYKQARKLSGNVPKGETSTIIVYANRFVPRLGCQAAEEEQRIPQSFSFLKRYRVFNIEQCDGLPDELYDCVPKRPEYKQIPHAEVFI